MKSHTVVFYPWLVGAMLVLALAVLVFIMSSQVVRAHSHIVTTMYEHHMNAGGPSGMMEASACPTGTDHEMRVYWDSGSLPYSVDIDKIEYRGRKPNLSGPALEDQSYRHIITRYYQWPGSAPWDEVANEGISAWFFDGSGCHIDLISTPKTLHTTVNLTNEAWIRQTMDYRVVVWACDSGGCVAEPVHNGGSMNMFLW
jgi:hypothetical protein